MAGRPTLPTGWEPCSIGCLCDLINGRGFKRSERSPSGLPIIRIQNLNNPNASFNYYDGEYSEGIYVRKGDMLFAWSGTPGTSFGAHIWNGPEGLLNQHIYRVLPDDEVIAKDYFVIALNNKLTELIEGAHGGVGLRHITKPKLEAAEISLPPLNEQRRIADRIDALQAKSLCAREALEAVGPLLEKFRQSVLAAAFRGDLTAEWRRQHPDVESAEKLLERIRAERRACWEEAEFAKMRAKGIKPKDDKWKAKYTEPEPVDAAELPELPEGWCWAAVEEISHVGTGATPKKGNQDYWDDGTVPWVTSGALNDDFVTEPQGYVTEKALAETNLSLFPCHTLLVAMYGEGKTRGKCSELSIEATTNQAIAGIQVCADKCVRNHLKSFLQHNYERTRMAASGGVQPNLNLSIVKRIVFPLPPEAEMQAMGKTSHDLIAYMGTMTSRTEAARGSLVSLDQSILAKAFRGELVPQDPNDEPASVLLERIKAEQEAATGKRRTRKKTA